MGAGRALAAPRSGGSTRLSCQRRAESVKGGFGIADNFRDTGLPGRRSGPHSSTARLATTQDVDTEVVVKAFLTRFIRRYRRALVSRVEEELRPVLPATARREAISFLSEVERSLGSARISDLQSAIQNTAERWSRQGLSRVDVHRVLLSPVLSPDLFETIHGERGEAQPPVADPVLV